MLHNQLPFCKTTTLAEVKEEEIRIHLELNSFVGYFNPGFTTNYKYNLVTNKEGFNEK